MGDSYPSNLPNSLANRARGFPAYFLGDIIPIGFIKPFEPLALANFDQPQGEFSLTLSGENVPNQKYTTPIYTLKLTAVQDDLLNVIPDEDGKIEKIYTAFIDYSWITNEPIASNSSQIVVGGFEVPRSGTTLSYTIHIVNDNKFIPPEQERGESNFYIKVGETVNIKVEPLFLAGEISIPYQVLGPVLDEVRFSRGIARLLPTKSLSLWLGFGGGVSLQPTSDPGFAFDLLGLNFGFLGGGIAGVIGLSFGEAVRRFAPVIYKDFIIKFGYSVVGSSQTIFDEEITINFEDMFERKESGEIKNKFLTSRTHVLVNKQLGLEDDYISKGFGFFIDKFEFNDLEKRYIGKGVTETLDPRDGISKAKYMSKKPIAFSIVKEKVISSIFTRQAKKYRQVNTTIPEENIPNGGCNVQLFISKNLISTNPQNFTPLRIYGTYEKVKNPNFRQVNSFNIKSATSSASDLNASARSFYQSSGFAFDTFFVNSKLTYKLDTNSEAFSGNELDFSDFANIQNLPAFFDTYFIPQDFRTSVDAMMSGSYGESELVKKRSTYRLASRRVRLQSENFPLSEGFFLAAAKIRYASPGSDSAFVESGGIGYVDYLGNFTLLIEASEILDKDWWNNYFGSVGETIDIASFIDEYNTRIVKYDRSLVVNSLLTDDEKVGYEEKLADAISVITPLSKGGKGIGICALDLLDLKNFNLKREFSSFSKNFSTQSNGSYYWDLSEANFDNAVNPNWALNIIQITNPPLSGTGVVSGRGTINAETFCLDVSPVDLTRNGRVFYEGIGGIESAIGVDPFEQLWIRSNLYDIKLGFASDYHCILGLYAHQYQNKIRAYNMIIADFLTFNNFKPYGFNFNLQTVESNQKNISLLADDSKWFGFPVDRVPFNQYGSDLVASEDDNSDLTLPENKIIYKKLNKQNFKVIYGEENIFIELEKPYRISNISLSIDKNVALKTFTKNQNNEKSFWRYIVSFDYPQYEKLNETDVVVFADFNKINFKFENGIFSSTTIPNYYGKKIYLSGEVIKQINAAKSQFSNIEIIVYEDEVYKNVSPTVSDCYPAIDGFTNGYISFLNTQDASSSIDFFATGDHDRRWRLFKNVFQSFTNETIYQCVIKADQKGEMIYMMFSVNGCLLCKPISGWKILNLYHHNQKVESKNAFLIGSNSRINIYGLFPDVYNRIQNIDLSFNDVLNHDARIQPAYVVQASYINNDFLTEAFNSTICCEAISSYIQKSQVEGSQIPNSISVEIQDGQESRSVYVNIPDQVKKLRGLISPRILLNRLPDEFNQMNQWPVNQPYTFEVLNNGSLIAFVLKEGFIHVFNSSSGKNWSFGFNLQDSYGFRPIKWGINDSDSLIDIDNKTSIAGLCPPIDNISSCYDIHSGSLTLFYVIENCIFGQTFTADQMEFLGNGGMYYSLQTKYSSKVNKSRPFYIIGKIPSDLISAARKEESFVHFGVISSTESSNFKEIENIKNYLSTNGFLESTFNITTNGKAPGACYIGSGVIRMYYEDENNQIKGLSITKNGVIVDLLIVGREESGDNNV